ncbi:hypothetical protein GCWU000325_01901 [Alloprevotella tannerae ATCC 51259]|uniref:Uncharacterized protein n=1 Tax=Alloprevotella tannerae ATCC 51259 TaxID=626522 RepID=C9LI43_9BACT|nr:hypothetical protein GCWU000325_01901 [Alloprevotella tannerae ATCC 51259]
MNKRLAEKNSAWFDIVLKVQINGKCITRLWLKFVLSFYCFNSL